VGKGKNSSEGEVGSNHYSNHHGGGIRGGRERSICQNKLGKKRKLKGREKRV